MRWTTLALLAALVIGACGATAAIAAPRFVLEDGHAVAGVVIHATRNSLMVRRDIGGMEQIATSQISRVDVTTPEGRVLSGAFLGWRDGRLALRVDGTRVWLEGDRIVERETRVAAAAAGGASSAATPPGTITPAQQGARLMVAARSAPTGGALAATPEKNQRT